MKVQELISFLKTLPKDAEVYFDLWQSDDRFHHFEIRKGNGKIQTDKESGVKCVSIGHADDCNAHRIFLKGE